MRKPHRLTTLKQKKQLYFLRQKAKLKPRYSKLKLKHIDLELQLNNLFDQRQYTRVNYSGLDIYTQTSQLRPRNIIGTIRFKLL